MAPDEKDDLRSRVEKLESEVERLRRQLERTQSFKAEAGPPPVINRPTLSSNPFEQTREGSGWSVIEHVPVFQKQPRVPQQPPLSESGETKAPSKRIDTEFKFGSQVLPRVGIVLVLIGIFYLVVYAIQNGWITMQMQFVGEILLCATLIGLGVWKLNEKEDFGQVLVGGGSCGLYFSFAGAHVYKELYGDETLVVLFLLLSLANLGFSWWRSSVSFWAIGFVGGLVGAALPLDKKDHIAVLLLAGIIVVAATFLAAHRRWLRAIEALWLTTGVFVLLVVHDALDRGTFPVEGTIAAFYLFSLVPIVAHALRFKPSEFDPIGWFEATAGAATALATLSFGREIQVVPHSAAVIAFSSLMGVVAWVVRKEVHAKLLAVSAIACATVISPVGLTAFQACLVYAALGVAASLFAHVRKADFERAGALFCATHVSLSIVAYAVAMGTGVVSFQAEMVMLGAMALGIGNLAFIAGRMESKMEEAVTAASVLLYLVLARASFVSFPNLGMYSTLFCTAAYAIVLSIVSLRAKWQGPALVAMFLTTVTTLLYWVDGMAGEWEASPGRQIAALSLTTIALVLSAMGTGRNQVEQRAVSIANSFIGCFVVVPLVWQGLESSGMKEQPAIVAAMCAYAVALALVSRLTKWGGNAILGMIVAIVSILYYVNLVYENPAFASNFLQMPLVVAMGIAVSAAAYYSAQNEKEHRAAWLAASIVGWYVVSRLFFLVLTLPSIAMRSEAAQQTSWALYAIVLCVIALRTKWRSVAVVASASTLGAAAYYWITTLAPTVTIGREQQLVVTCLTSVAVVLCTLAAGKDVAERKNLSVLGALVGWAVLGRVFGILLLAAGMESAASMSFAWSTYAGVLLKIGFVLDVKPLRITSLALFGVTIGKVFLVDLAELEAYIRVFLLIAIGALLILGGYIYLRRREDMGAPT